MVGAPPLFVPLDLATGWLAYLHLRWVDDGECGIMQGFFLGAAGYGEVRSFNAPRSAWVACIPELNAVKALNDQALAQEAEANRQAAKENERRSRELQAKENDPNHLLTRTYYDYIVIKKCFDQRQRYMAVNISDQEMALAKTTAKGIEDSIQKTNPGIDKDSAWKLASSDSDAWMTDGDQTELTLAHYNNQFQLDPSDRYRCQRILQALEKRFKQFAPEATAVKKDF